MIAAIVVLFGGAAAVTAISHQSPTHAAGNKLATTRSLPLTPSQEVANYLDKGEDAHYCDGCTLPLINDGGPVVNTTGTTGLTITPIFWQPTGSSATNSFPANYQSIIDGFIGNVAAASGSTSNVFSVATEYYSQINGVKTPITYKITMGTPSSTPPHSLGRGAPRTRPTTTRVAHRCPAANRTHLRFDGQQSPVRPSPLLSGFLPAQYRDLRGRHTHAEL